jgi:hypothetical protein
MRELEESRWRPPRRFTAEIVNWRAEQIVEPVARLRFLRRSAAYLSDQPVRRALRSAQVRHFSALVLALGLLPIPTVSDGAGLKPTAIRRQMTAPGGLPQKVWQVESTEAQELYSNGLRIEKRYQLPRNEPVPFVRYRVTTEETERRSTPYGIVFHTTESHALPFEETQNGALRRIGAGVLQYVRQIRAYHFVIDRFGRVWRVVPESEPAHHAGNSVWAEEQHFYLNLNASFLGVSFEGPSRDETGQTPVTAAQIHSGRLLTDLLRSRYQIAARNCVTHAQVSVNPENMGIGYHTDWAANFPFEQIGLPDNYQLPPPAMTLFGFGYDTSFREATGERLWRGLDAADLEVQSAAVAHKTSLQAWRRGLVERYRRLYNAVKQPDFSQEGN